MTTTPRPAATSSRLIPRRGLRRDEAAVYVGISPSKFDGLVGDGRMPAPRLLDGCVIWDVRELDAAFDNLPRRGETALAPDDSRWDDIRA